MTKLPEDLLEQSKKFCERHAYDYVSNEGYAFRLGMLVALESEVVRDLVKALECVDANWDVTDVTRVVPKTHKNELFPNDSLAAGSIIGVKRAIEKFRRATEE